MKKKQIIPIDMVLNGLTKMVPTVLVIGFSIILFEKDSSGISAAYLEPASLLGTGFAGLIGGFFFQAFFFLCHRYRRTLMRDICFINHIGI